MIRKALIVAAMLSLVATASAEIQMEDIEFESPVYGGETLERDVIISWTGEQDATVNLNSSLSPDTDRINLSLSQNQLEISSGGQETITMFLETDYFIQSQSINVSLEASSNVEEVEEEESSSSGGSSSGRSYIIEADPDYSPEMDEPEVNESETEANDSSNESEQDLEEPEGNVSRPENGSDLDSAGDSDEEGSDYLLPLLALGVLGTISIVYIVYLYSRKPENEKEYEFE